MAQERINGPTPNGGAYAVAYFSDASGAPAPKHLATNAEITEFAEDGTAIERTYAQLGKTAANEAGADPTSDRAP